MAAWDIALLKRLGAPVTKENRRFLATWQRWEGGHTKNNARYNWLNTTAGNQYPAINSVGVRRFPNFKTGIDYTVQTLQNGRYNWIVEGLRSGNPYDESIGDIAGDLSVWVSGKRDARPDYAAKILEKTSQAAKFSTLPDTGEDADVEELPSKGGKGKAVAALIAAGTALLGPGAGGAASGEASQPMSESVGVDEVFGTLRRTSGYKEKEKSSGDRLSRLIGKSFTLPPPEMKLAEANPLEPTPASPKNVKDDKKGGGRVYVPGTRWKGSHITDGLDWNNGRRTAADIMLPPGTPVGAPEAGEVVRWGSAQGGEALYFRGKSGTLYWLGHIDGRLPVGSKVKRGQRIAVISADHAAPHLHIDRKL